MERMFYSFLDTVRLLIQLQLMDYLAYCQSASDSYLKVWRKKFIFLFDYDILNLQLALLNYY